MKKLLLLALAASGLVRPLFGLNWSSLPSSVPSGQAYTVSATHASSTPQINKFVLVQILKNGALASINSGTGYNYVSVTCTYNATDSGVQTVNYSATAQVVLGAVTESYSINGAVNITMPNTAPTITWVQNPANVPVNQWFTIQARGNDSDGNLTNVSVWRNGIPFALNGGGNGYQNYSDANGYSQSTPGTVTFSAQSRDGNGATSPVIYHTVNIYQVNSITFNSTNWPATVYVGQTVGFYYNVTNTGSKPWGANHYLGLRDGNWQGVTFPSVNGCGVGWNGNVNFSFTAPGAPGTYTYYIQALENNVEWFGPVQTMTITVINRAPGPMTLSASGSTVAWNGAYGHYTMQAYNSITATSTLQDPDGNLVDHTLRFQKVTGAAPLDGNWLLLGDHAPSNGSNSTKQATLPNGSYPQQITPGRWDFNTFGHDGYISHPGLSITVWAYGTTNNAAFVSQVVKGVTNPVSPVSATTGDSFQVTVTMSNTGDRPWENDATPHKLQSLNGHWGVTSVALPGGNPVFPPPQTPGSAAFVFNVTAPTAPGNYPFQWQMMEEFSGSPTPFGATSTLVTVSVADNDAPAKPGGLFASVVTASSLKIDWPVPSDNAGVTAYEAERQGAAVVPVSSNTCTFTGLGSGITYQVRVRARDAAGLWSPWSDWFPFATTYDPNADNDGDGVTNGVEQTLGLNPNDPSDVNVSNYTYDKINQLKRGPGGEYQKDAEGNIKQVLP